MTDKAPKYAWDASSDEHTEKVEKLAKHLKNELKYVLTHHLGLQIASAAWISAHTLSDVASQSIQAHADYRHRYPFSVSSLKYISVITFWIVKLKPINPLAFKMGGNWVDCANINERAAYIWLREQILKMSSEGGLGGFISAGPEIVGRLDQIFKGIEEASLYDEQDSTNTPQEPDGVLQNTKLYETLHYLRYKKITAINIYESVMYSLMPLKLELESHDE